MSDVRCTSCGTPLPADAGRAQCGFCAAAAIPVAPAASPFADRVGVQTAPHPAGSSSAPSTMLAPGTACPRCGSPLLEGRSGTTTMLGCHGCGGVWIDRETVRLLANHRDPDAEELARRMGSKRALDALLAIDRTKELTCPACRAPLFRAGVGHQGATVDVCDVHGTWFDWGELAMLAAPPPAAPDLTEQELEAAGIPGDANTPPGFASNFFEMLLGALSGRRRR